MRALARACVVGCVALSAVALFVVPAFAGPDEDRLKAELRTDRLKAELRTAFEGGKGADLACSTYLGGSDKEYAFGVAVDASGAAYVAGRTYSDDFPATPGAFDTSHNGAYDVFIAKLSPDGASLVWATYLGGSGDDVAAGIAVDGAGAVYVVGYTESGDFPTTPGAFDESHNGGYDAFVAKLSASGDTLLYSTYLGGAGDDFANGISVADTGAAFVTGKTYSIGFPVTANAFDTSHNGGLIDAFVTALSADGDALVCSTFLGGAGPDEGYAVAVDTGGAAYVAGYSVSSDFPTTAGAFDEAHNGGYDAFVAKLAPGASVLSYATFLGGSSADRARGIAVDASGAAVVCGYTLSGDFPVTGGAFDPSHNGDYDAFVSRFTPSGGALAHSTYLGGDAADFAHAIAVDDLGRAYVAGDTNADSFPTTVDAFDTTRNGDYDGFVARLSGDGAMLEYATYLGGGANDFGAGIALANRGTVYAAGRTYSDDFPATPGAFDTSLGGQRDAFAAKFVWPEEIPPTVTDVAPPPGTSLAVSDVDIDVTFSEEVFGVEPADMALAGTAATGASVQTPTDLGGNTWRFPVTGLARGALIISLAPDVDDIEDADGNDLNPSPTTWAYGVILPGPLDFGDAPEPAYPTLSSNDGARHQAVAGFFLGAGIDDEPDGQPGDAAMGDDLDGGDDEDGVSFPAALPYGLAANIDVVASAAGKLVAWIDFNADGDWADADERVFVDEPLVAGSNCLAFAVPLTATLTERTYARFRFSGLGALSFDGLAPDGEVEDYAIGIGLGAPVLDAEPPFTAGTSNTLAWSSVPGAAEYWVELDDDPLFGSPDDHSGWIVGLSHAFGGLADAQTYHYRAKARNVMQDAGSWTQTSQAEFEADDLVNVSATASPGDVVLNTLAPEIPGRFSNPSFESGYDDWTYGEGGVNISADISSFPVLNMPSDGAAYAMFFTWHNQPVVAGGYRSYSQAVDLGDVAEIRFDAGLRAPQGWENKIQGEVRIDGTVEWSEDSEGSYSGQSIDVSSLSGTHTIEVRLQVLSGGTYGSQHVYFDNFRACGPPGFAPSGTITSVAITPASLYAWGEMTFSATTPAGAALSVDVLPATGSTPIPGYESVPSGGDLSGIAETTIRIRANLATALPDATPALYNWAVTWHEGPATVFESGFSNVEWSTQDAVAPAATIVLFTNSPTGSDAVDFDVAFSEEVAPTFTSADVLLEGTLAGAATFEITGVDPAYSITVTPDDPDADGTLGVTIGPGVTDAAGNAFGGGSSSLCAIYNWFGFRTQPENQRSYIGDAVWLSAAADCGSDTLAYRWWFESARKAAQHVGGNTDTLEIGPLSLADAGDYWCDVTYDGTTYWSNTATLEVAEHLRITSPPEGGEKPAGESHTFSVGTAGGYTPLRYVWKKDGAPVSEDPVYAIGHLSTSDSGLYTVQVADDNVDVVESTPVLLTVTTVMPGPALAGIGILLAVSALVGASALRRT